MTNWEQIAISQLSRCSLQSYSANKRFINTMASKHHSYQLSEPQREYLWSCVRLYRRQLPRLTVQWAALYRVQRNGGEA